MRWIGSVVLWLGALARSSRGVFFVEDMGICPENVTFLCNRQSEEARCTCFHADPAKAWTAPSCDDRFRIRDVSAHVLRLRTHLPRIPQLFRQVDELFVKVLADYTNIRPDLILLVRKRCNEHFLFFYFALLKGDEQLRGRPTLTDADLSKLSPRLFTRNLNLMTQDWVPVLEIMSVDRLPPISGVAGRRNRYDPRDDHVRQPPEPDHEQQVHDCAHDLELPDEERPTMAVEDPANFDLGQLFVAYVAVLTAVVLYLVYVDYRRRRMARVHADSIQLLDIS